MKVRPILFTGAMVRANLEGHFYEREGSKLLPEKQGCNQGEEPSVLLRQSRKDASHAREASGQEQGVGKPAGAIKGCISQSRDDLRIWGMLSVLRRKLPCVHGTGPRSRGRAAAPQGTRQRIIENHVSVAQEEGMAA